LKLAYELYLKSLRRLTFEHVRYPGIYVNEPGFLVVLSMHGQDLAVYGGYCIEPEQACDAVLFRAARLLHCSMVNSILTTCSARLVCDHGIVYFEYQPEEYSYQTKKTHDPNTDTSVPH
jgi:hypothetical protein